MNLGSDKFFRFNDFCNYPNIIGLYFLGPGILKDLKELKQMNKKIFIGSDHAGFELKKNNNKIQK